MEVLQYMQPILCYCTIKLAFCFFVSIIKMLQYICNNYVFVYIS